MTDYVSELRLAERMLPQPDAVSAQFWDGLGEGELRLQRCRDCGTAQYYPRTLCAACGGEVDWLTASGLGVVHTYTVVRTNPVEPYKSLVPYVFAVVELDEGPRMLTNIIGVDPDSVRIGLEVRLELVTTGDVTVPFFTTRSPG
jgi:uncharacterized OB-fold protein